MEKRGVTLAELLTALFIGALVGTLCVRYLLPVLTTFSRYLASSGSTPELEKTLASIRSDAYLAGTKGTSFGPHADSTRLDWTLGFVRRITPSSTGQELWEKELRLYRYHHTERTVTLKTFTNLNWPDGTPRLTGEPLHFTASELWALPTQDERVLCRFTWSQQRWSDLNQPWPVRYAPPRSETLDFILDLRAELY